jgi:hypothetical protein
MKTKEQIVEYASKQAHDHFYCDNGSVWEPFENKSEDEVNELEDALAHQFEQAMLWVVK